MTKEEFSKRMYEIHKNFNAAKQNLYVEYIKTTASFKEGDVVSDGDVTICVDIITAGYISDGGHPSILYIGFELKKDGTPKKSGARSSIYEERIKKINARFYEIQ